MHGLIASLVAFAFGFIGSMPLTGPVAVLVVSRAAQRQFGLALRIGMGAALAEAVYAAVAFWGFATFLARHEGILTATHAVSAVVLGSIGVYFTRWKPDGKDALEKKHRTKGFLLGFSVSMLNPTLLATWSAAVAVLYSRQLITFSVPLAVPFGLAAGAGVAGWEVVMVALLRRASNKLPEKTLRWIVRGMGVLLIVVGVIAAVDFARAMMKGK